MYSLSLVVFLLNYYTCDFDGSTPGHLHDSQCGPGTRLVQLSKVVLSSPTTLAATSPSASSQNGIDFFQCSFLLL